MALGEGRSSSFPHQGWDADFFFFYGFGQLLLTPGLGTLTLIKLVYQIFTSAAYTFAAKYVSEKVSDFFFLEKIFPFSPPSPLSFLP